MGTIAGTVTNCAVGSCTSNVAVEEIINSFSVYPNPTENLITFQNALIGHEWKITDVNGNLIMSGIISDKKTQFNLENFATGIYFLKVKNESECSVTKVIKN